MKKLYSRFNYSTFIYSAILSCVSCDIIIFFYIYNKFADKERVIEIISKYDARIVNPMLFDDIFVLMLTSLKIMIFSIALFHMIIYFFFYKKSRVCRRYVVVLSWIGGVCSVILFFGNIIIRPANAFLFLLIGLLYLYVAFGFKYFPLTKK